MMQSVNSVTYPVLSHDGCYGRGKLPPVHMARRTCVGRIWIFLLLGVLLVVLGVVSFGVVYNVYGITSSKEYTEILPLYLNSGLVVASGIIMSFLFWKRFKVLVFVAVLVSIATGLLTSATAVLTSTHILQPIRSLVVCRYFVSLQLCRCFSPYSRDMFDIDYSDTEETQYDFKSVSSCQSVQTLLPQLLYALIGIFAIVGLVSFGSTVVALLVLRLEVRRRGFYSDENYQEVYTASNSSVLDQSESEAEVIPEVITIPDAINSTDINCKVKPSGNSGTINSIRSVQSSVSSHFANNLATVKPTIDQDKTDSTTLKELGKESLANRYKISKIPDNEIAPRQRLSKTPDREIAPRQRLSKTPDREISTRRRNSLSHTKRLSRSCDSLDSSGKENSGKLDTCNTSRSEGKKRGRLKEHRRHGKRAATVHTLDPDQLLLILNLQMRYLQETRDQQKSQKDLTSSNPRRAITPQPSTQKSAIPQKVRSHTPQPYRANGKRRSQQEQEFYQQIEELSRKVSQNITAADAGTSGKNRDIGSQRKASDSSSTRTSDSWSGNSGKGVCCENVDAKNRTNGRREEDTYLTAQQMYRTHSPRRDGYNPYFYDQQTSSHSASNIHYVTYSDNMLNGQQMKPKSRPSVQNYFLPPEPMHRGTRNDLPPQPISRQRISSKKLPPQPIHRGNSAFHVVDRSSKSRSPSVCSDQNVSCFESTPKRKTKKDYAEVAIRDNFKMNASQFILRDAPQTNRNPSYSRNEGTNQARLSEKLDSKMEILPPYSGPPTYNDYVSSCDTSVNSSLSSNSEDIYSMPRRRSQREKNPTNHTKADRNLSNQSEPSRISSNQKKSESQESDYMYGNAEGKKTYKNIPKSSPEGHRLTQQTEEVIYSCPAKSKVKQCIVPEDYYSGIVKRNQSNEVTKLTNQNNAKYVNESTRSANQNIAYYSPHGEASMQNGGNVYNYRNPGISPRNGLPGINPGACNQIAPDAKYHDYEDMYDYPENVQTSLSLDKSLTQYALGSHGNCNPAGQVVVSRQSSPRKQRAPYPVNMCNVTRPYLDTDVDLINVQVTESVENVHAEKMNGVPRIRLTDVGGADANVDDDDDVFTNDGEVMNSGGKCVNRSECDVVKSGNENYSKADIPQSCVYSPESADTKLTDHGAKQCHVTVDNSKLTNENAQVDHMTESSNQETDSLGYMKMSLPGKLVQADSPGVNDVSANENEGQGHVIDESTNDSERQVPDGTEGDDGSEYEEETGV